MKQTHFLIARDLKKSYRLGETTVPALQGLDFSMDRGEFTAIIGASGSGKTTLLNIIGCIDKPDSGSIYMDSIDVGRLDENSLSDFRNRKIGYVFQSFNLIPVLNVYENIELPLVVNPAVTARERRERVLQAAHDVQLDGFLQQIPDKLSGGQRQRVAIARALVTHPGLILADEPTANLDSNTALRILDLMQTLNENNHVTFLFSTHDEKLMSRVKRVVRISDGTLADVKTG